MGFTCGIVGLPNVGKSTLFNALTSTMQAEAANYPFCTIEPNVGRVSVPDARLDRIAALAQSARIVPTQLDFADIAGLVRGASKGEGLGNQFLSHIRSVDAIIHVVRCFDDDNVTHVENRIDPIADAETVETELLLADLDSIERRLDGAAKKARGGDADAKARLALMERVLVALREGKPARAIDVGAADRKAFDELQLLTAKPVLFVCNVEEANAATGNAHTGRFIPWAAARDARAVVICAAIEAEVAQIDDAAERREYLAAIGLQETGLSQIVREGYHLLDLVTFFTAGPKESRAWTVHRGALAPAAAGVIHTDFERGFIRAETISYADFVACGGETGARDAGKMRAEGKAYAVQDGDIMLFRFNV
ncbi:MAG: redox-regulated ATPase YchF [Alphaproteobacteria bacterium]|nr:redox-regulated ATPase YchF [Alphaproteobacteria bacterium]